MANLQHRPEPGGVDPLTADELQQVRWLLGGVLTLLGISTVAYMDVGAWAMLLACALTVIATTLWPGLPARVPRLVHVLAFPFIAAFFIGDLVLSSELLPAMVRLDLLLLLYRALVYRQRRDDLQVIVLGLFLVVVAGVLTVSLAFAVQILAYTACALLFLLVLNLAETKAAAKGALPASAPVQEEQGASAGTKRKPAPAWAAHVRWPRLARRVVSVTDWRVFALGSVLFAGVIAGTALLFMVIPRFQLENGMFLERFVSKKARTGFSDTIKFGDVTEIQQDNSVALHVDVSDPTQIPASPYWRMLVLNEYADGGFRMSPDLRAANFRAARIGTAVAGAVRGRRNPATWTFYLEPGVSRYLPIPGPFAQLRFAEAQTHHNAPELALVALSKEPVTMTAYQIQGFDPTRRLVDPPAGHYDRIVARGGRPGLAAEDERRLQQLLAEAMPTPASDAAGFSSRLCAWLRERHSYSLSPRIPAGTGDALVRWAVSREAGHCELFAGACVLLARTAGYPARVVTGFRGGTWNAYSNGFTVRNSDAHAWAEIFDRASGTWLRADPLELPTSQNGGQSAAEAALAQRTDRSWGARLDSLRVFWYRRVVSFDQQTQVNTIKAAKEAAQATVVRVRDWLRNEAESLRAWARSPWDVSRLLRFGGAVLAAGALTWFWRWGRRFISSRWTTRGDQRNDPVRREAGRWLQRLGARAGKSAATDVVRDLQRVRFGARETWPEVRPLFRRARAEARHSAR